MGDRSGSERSREVRKGEKDVISVKGPPPQVASVWPERRTQEWEDSALFHVCQGGRTFFLPVTVSDNDSVGMENTNSQTPLFLCAHGQSLQRNSLPKKPHRYCPLKVLQSRGRGVGTDMVNWIRGDWGHCPTYRRFPPVQKKPWSWLTTLNQCGLLLSFM